MSRIETVEAREVMANKFSIGTISPPITTQTTVADAAVQNIAGADTVDESKTEADLLSCATAINLIIVRLKAFGLIA